MSDHVELKRCVSCFELKPLSAYIISKRSTGALKTKCKQCRAKEVKLLRTSHPRNYKSENISRRDRRARQGYRPRECDRHAERRYRFKRNYPGFILDMYNSLLKNVCAICGQHDHVTKHGVPYRLSVDHNHATGKVRGLLCRACNFRLGIVENTEFVIPAQAYLERYR